MGRGISSGGGQSSLGYLFGGGEAPKAAAENAEPVRRPAPTPVDNSKQITAGVENAEPVRKPAPAPAPPSPAPASADNAKQIPAGVPAKTTNNYFRADGQNCGNFITDRPSTKVHAAPGGGSSLDYLFGAPRGGN